MQWLRNQDLYKHPGVSETVDWAHALIALGMHELDPDAVQQTLGWIIKNKRDTDKLHELNLAATIERLLAGKAYG